jgi:hypothetical protein
MGHVKATFTLEGTSAKAMGLVVVGEEKRGLEMRTNVVDSRHSNKAAWKTLFCFRERKLIMKSALCREDTVQK